METITFKDQTTGCWLNKYRSGGKWKPGDISLKCKYGCFSSGNAVYFPWQLISSDIIRNIAQLQPSHTVALCQVQWTGVKNAASITQRTRIVSVWPHDKKMCSQTTEAAVDDTYITCLFIHHCVDWTEKNGREKRENRGIKAEEIYEREKHNKSQYFTVVGFHQSTLTMCKYMS